MAEGAVNQSPVPSEEPIYFTFPWESSIKAKTGKIFILLTWQKTYLNLFTEFEKQKVEINSTRKFVFDVIVSILKKKY